MKRFFLSSSVLGSFLIFSLYYHGRDLPTPSTLTQPLILPTTLPTPVTFIPIQPAAYSSPMPTSRPNTTNGIFIGDAIDAYYGYIQVQISMQNGRLTDIQFLQFPNDRSHSIEINQYALPLLKSEAIKAQSAHVDIVSGATDSSQAFIESLQSALTKAKG